MVKGKQVDFSSNQFKSQIQANPTADRTANLPDKTGTIAFLDDAQPPSPRLSELATEFAAAPALAVPRKNAAGTAIEYAVPAAGGGSSTASHPGFESGLYYFSPDITAIGSANCSANAFYASYLPIHFATTFDRIACEVTTASAANGRGRMGIYSVGSNGKPSARILDSGEFTIDSVGVKEFVINLTFQPGWYAVCSLTSLTASFKAVTAQVSLLSKTGFGSIPGLPLTALRTSLPYATLPTTAPAIGGLGGTNNHPLIGLRAV